jgi:hypothetical protein
LSLFSFLPSTVTFGEGFIFFPLYVLSLMGATSATEISFGSVTAGGVTAGGVAVGGVTAGGVIAPPVVVSAYATAAMPPAGVPLCTAGTYIPVSANAKTRVAATAIRIVLIVFIIFIYPQFMQ